MPKTAGTTFKAVINNNFRETEIIRNSVYNCISEINKMNEDELEKIKILVGHFYFGLHKNISSPCTYITFLRNPLDRATSHYYHVLRKSNHPLHDEYSSIAFEEFIISQTDIQVDNFQTRRLSGLTIEELPFGDCSQKILEIAKNNIKRNFSVVGVTEKFDESLILINKILGWKIPLYTRVNVDKNRLQRNILKQEFAAIFNERNKFDIELYRFVSDRLENSIATLGYLFDRKIRKIKFSNEFYTHTIQFKAKTYKFLERIGIS